MYVREIKVRFVVEKISGNCLLVQITTWNENVIKFEVDEFQKINKSQERKKITNSKWEKKQEKKDFTVLDKRV